MTTAAQIPLISRQYDVLETSYFPGLTITQVAKADSQRVAIGFACPSGISMGISTRSNLTVTDCAMCHTGGGIEWISFADHGSFCQLDWFAVCSTPAGKLSVFEVWYRDR